MRPAREPLELGGQVGPRRGAADDRADAPCVEQLDEVGLDALAVGTGEEVEARRTLGRRRVARVGEHDAAEIEVPEEQGPRTIPSSSASMPPEKPGQHVAPTVRDARERAHGGLAADEVAHDVDAPSVGRVEHRRGDVVGAVVDRRRPRRAPGSSASFSSLPAVARPGHRRRAELHRRRADAAGAGVDEHRLARLEVTALERARGGRRGRGRRRRAASTSSSASGASNVMSASTTTCCAWAPNAPAAVAMHPAPEPGVAAVPGRDHLADDLHAERVGQRRVDRPVAAEAAVDLVVVERRRRGADDELARALPGLARRRRAPAPHSARRTDALARRGSSRAEDGRRRARPLRRPRPRLGAALDGIAD